MNCKFPYYNKELCTGIAIKDKKFCKNHMYYEIKIDLNNLKWCELHIKLPLLNNKCNVCDKENEKKNKIKLCKGFNQKGEKCNFKSLDNDEYCKLHQSYKKWKELTDSGKIICNNWIRGCWIECNDNFTRCIECRVDERLKETNLRNKKKITATDFNSRNTNEKMCSDCNGIVIQLFNNYCYECYKQKKNIKRNPRDKFLIKLYESKKGAKKRNLEWKLTDDYAINLMKNQCHYCFDKYNIFGIDRLDNNKGYEINNSVSCCFQCNSMKSTKTKEDFLNMCEHISTYNNLYKGKLYEDIFMKSSTILSKFIRYKIDAEKRNLIFNLSKELFDKLLKNKCFYCGNFSKDGANGIDRIDSSQGYTQENCESCCKTCNFMKLNFSKDQFIEKCLAITFKNNGLLYKPENINLEKEKLVKMFENIKFIIETDKNDFIYEKNNAYYKNLIWNGNIDDLKKIKPQIIFVDTPEMIDIWKYYRNTVSSLPFQKESRLVGKIIKILVKDTKTNKYLGIMSLNSDLLHLEDRDEYIKWTNKQRIGNKKINYLMNLSTCVPLQPFGFNFNGGKLLSKLAFSKEIADYYYLKYNQKLLGITTTGFHGKSIQYDRLKELKFVGFTKGFSTYKIPTELVDQSRIYLMSKGINYSKKLFILTKTIQDLGLNKSDYLLDNPKGIYFGFCHPQAQDFLCEKIDKLDEYNLKTTNEIFNEWINRWAEKRYNHLITINNLKIDEKEINIIKKESKTKEINHKEIYEKNKEYFKKYYLEKKIIEKTKEIIPHNKIILPSNFSLYEEKDKFYLQYIKSIKGDTRKTGKKVVKTNNLQNELNNLVLILKNKYPELIIENTNIINSNLFQLKEKENNKDLDKEIIIEPRNKPILPINFSICNINCIDYFQYFKKINNEKYQFKSKINSYNLQDEFDIFIDKINNKYKLQIEKSIINNLDNWKTINKISKNKN